MRVEGHVTWLSVLAVLLASCLSASSAAAASYSFNWDITNKTGAAAKDFHLTILSDKVLTKSDEFKGAFGAVTATKKAGGLIYDVTWDGGTVADNGMTHVGLGFTGKVGAKIKVLNVRWTDENHLQQGPPTKQPSFPGFKGKPLFGFTMNNTRNEDNPDTPEDEAAESQDMFLDDLRFDHVLNPYPLDALMAGLLGGQPAEPEILLPVDQEYPPLSGSWNTLPSVLPDSGFLVMEGTSSYSGPFGLIENHFIYQTQLPEPAGLFLFLGAVGLAALRRPRRQEDCVGNRSWELITCESNEP